MGRGAHEAAAGAGPRLLAPQLRAIALPGGLRGPWLRPGRAHPPGEGDGLGGATSRASASRSCRSGSRKNLATFLPWLPERPGWERGEVGFLRLRGKCLMWEVHTVFRGLC